MDDLNTPLPRSEDGTDTVPRRVIYVDDQEDIVWSTTRLLARTSPELKVEGFTDPMEALEAVKQHPPDILVTDLRMEGMSGLELLVAARNIIPELPVIVVTAYGGPSLTAALRGRSLVEYLEKPIRAEKLVDCIDRLLDRGMGFQGAISLPMLPDLVQVYTLSKTSGALAIRRGARSGTIWFDGGQIVHAVCGEQTGETAVYELLSWQGGEFHLDTAVKAPERTITVSWQEVLLEGCRLLDESERDAEDLDDVFESLPTQVQVPADLQAEPADRTVGTKDESEPGSAGWTQDDRLQPLTELDGFVYAAYLGPTVRALLTPGQAGSIDGLSVAAFEQQRALEAIRSMAQDLGSDEPVISTVFTLPDEYHLIWPLEGQAENALFLVLERKQADLAGARKCLREIAGILTEDPSDNDASDEHVTRPISLDALTLERLLTPEGS